MNFKFQKICLNKLKKFKNLKMKILKKSKIILIQILLLEKLLNDESIVSLKKLIILFIV